MSTSVLLPDSSGLRSAGIASSILDAAPSRRRVWIVLGPAGSGKSSVCKRLAAAVGGSYIEGDDYHPPANIAKMSAGQPLTDQDRWDWLRRLGDACMSQPCAASYGPRLPSYNTYGKSEPTCNIFLSCSALRREYRDRLRLANCPAARVTVRFIYLHVPLQTALARVSARKDHYMGARMVASQYETLQEPADDEPDVMWLEAGECVEDVVVEALQGMASVSGPLEDLN